MRTMQKVLVGAVLVLTAMVVGPAFGQGGRQRGGGFGGGEMFLVTNEDVQKELSLVDDQVEKLKKLSETQREEMGKLFTGMRGLSEEERTAKMTEIRDTMTKRSEDYKKQIDAILLPHQTQRLSQIATQQRLRSNGGSGLSVDGLTEVLKLSDETKAKLKAKADENRKSVQEKMANVRKEAENDILSVLTPEQREKYKELVGDPFEMQQPQWGGGGPGGGRRPGGNNPGGTPRGQ